MKLADFPRPPGDTRLGIHWSPGIADAVGTGPLREQWIPLLKEMGVTWVKLLHTGGLAVAEEFLAAGIMPVVRLYRPRPNTADATPGQGTLGPEEVAALEAFLSIGVRYFEFNNEPNLPDEWREPMPEEAVARRIVARNAIRDMETILARGGLPAIPAVSVGCAWDLMADIIAEGGRDLLDEGVWWAVHNYDVNHPLDYPYDAVNQDGELLDPATYKALGPAAWNGPRWGQRTLDFVNQQRSEGVNPGATIADDATCWLAYRRFADLALQHLGFHIPILSTENGPIVGEDDDPRYPTTTPEIHRDKVVEMCRIMMGTSDRFEQAPDYYFCTAFWLLADRALGSTGGWEAHAWISDRWPGGKLPAVDAMRTLPKRVWQPRGDAMDPPAQEGSRVFGVVRGGAGRRLVLRGVTYSAQAIVRPDEHYTFEGVPAGTYRLSVLGTDAVRAGIEVDGVNAVEVNFDLRPESPRESEIEGQVVNGAGRLVILSGPEAREALLDESERFRFADLPAGQYVLTVADTDIEEHITLDGRNQVTLTLQLPEPESPPPAWTATVEDGGASPGFGVVRCRVTGQENLPVRLWADGWEGSTRNTGTKPEFGPDVCEFAPLGGGTYYIEPQGLGVRATVQVDPSRITWVIFSPRAAEPPANSIIEGVVINGAGREVTLSGPVERATVADATGAFRFEGLPAGTYTVAVAGTEVRHEGIMLDGENRAHVQLEVPLPRESRVWGRVAGGRGMHVQLTGPEGTLETVVEADETYSFDNLPPGTYTLRVVEADAEKTDIVLDGTNTVEVSLAVAQTPESPSWTFTVEDGGPGPGFGVVRCEVTGRVGLPVRLWAVGWAGVVRRTGSKPEYGPFVCEFAPLGGGTYYIEPEGLGVRVQLRLDGRSIVWVRFFPELAPEPGEEEITPVPKVYDLYLWLGRMPRTRAEFEAVLQYAARFAPEVGADMEQARRARHVIVLGETLSEAQERVLHLSGSRVVRVPDNWEEVLTDLVARGVPVP